MRILFLTIFLFGTGCVFSQPLKSKLDAALRRLSADAQFEHSILAMYVVDANTGAVIFDRSAEAGLTPASCLKLVTSASAFELLGKEFTYQTQFSALKNAGGNAMLSIAGTGDPSFGSERFESTKEDVVMRNLLTVLRKSNIKSITAVRLHAQGFASQSIPDGWVWQDLGNYFGAGAAGINWRENQFQLTLGAGNKIGEPTEILKFSPSYSRMKINNECVTGPPGSGDKSYLYLGMDGGPGYLRGTIPQGELAFTIFGAVPDPRSYFHAAITDFLQKRDMLDTALTVPVSGYEDSSMLFVHQSPSLDSMNYWFMKKSINLYGEAFAKSIGLKYKAVAATDSGIAVIKQLWQTKGITQSSLNIIDGSGLSPANRLTARSLVQILQYARKQSWSRQFYNALPEMNGIKMKDGYIGGVRSYAGIIKSASGSEYIFSFIVNNFYGNPKTVREKMWKVLDLLK